MNAITRAPGQPVTASLVPQNMEQAVNLAKMMAMGKMMPEHLRNSPGDCLMVIEQAMRWNMSPFAVAQCTSSVKGRLMFEGKLVAAVLESSGVLEGFLDYQFSGSGMERTIKVSATRRGETVPREIEIKLKDVVTSNEWWKKQPDQQLVYSGARNWGRRWAPAVLLGVYSREEFDQESRIPAPETFGGTIIEATVVEQSNADLAGDGIPEHDGPAYPFTTGNGTKVFHSAADWIARWRKLISDCKKIAALDKLESARAINAPVFVTIRTFDPETVETIETDIRDAIDAGVEESVA